MINNIALSFVDEGFTVYGIYRLSFIVGALIVGFFVALMYWRRSRKKTGKPAVQSVGVNDAVSSSDKTKHILPAKRYRMKLFLLFSDLWLVIVLIYYCIIRNIANDVDSGDFSWVSTRMMSNYVILGITVLCIILGIFFKKTRSIKTRIDRENDLRTDRTIHFWSVMFDWGWPFLFTPTMAFLVLFGVVGVAIDRVIPASHANQVVQSIMGGVMLFIFLLNALVAIIKVKPGALLIIVVTLLLIFVIALLQSPGGVLWFFKGIRHTGVKLEPLGYLMLAYIWAFMLRIIWVKGLFFYQAVSPNRLYEQHGLAESGGGQPRTAWDIEIDTEDVILRFFGVGLLIVHFLEERRRPIINVVSNISKKAKYAERAASVMETTH